jgi:hypothetical protein
LLRGGGDGTLRGDADFFDVENVFIRLVSRQQRRADTASRHRSGGAR